MRPEGNSPLDLNILPDDYMSSRDGRQQLVLDQDTSTSGGGGGGGGGVGALGVGGGGVSSSSSSGGRRKKSGKDESEKVYECRFCSLKFCKSQALGGHMNRHRQERETEVLNRARQLVYSNEAAYGPPPPPLYGATHMSSAGGYHSQHHHNHGVYSPTTSRLFAGSSSAAAVSATRPPPLPPPLHQPRPYLYTSSVAPPGRSTYTPPHPHPPMQDYYVGHAVQHQPSSTNVMNSLGSGTSGRGGVGGGGGGSMSSSSTSYACIGAPVGFVPNSKGSTTGGGSEYWG